MSVIYKFALPSPGGQLSLDLGKNAQIVRAGLQNGAPYLWAIVDQIRTPGARTFAVIGTGWLIPDDGVWVGSYEEGVHIWHVIEKVGP